MYIYVYTVYVSIYIQVYIVYVSIYTTVNKFNVTFVCLNPHSYFVCSLTVYIPSVRGYIETGGGLT